MSRGLHEYLVKELLEQVRYEDWPPEYKELAKKLDYKGKGKE